MHAPVRLVPPASAPVTLAEAKAHVRVEHAEDDAYLGTLIGAAVSYLDGWSGAMGRCLVTQTWRQDYDAFDAIMRLPLWPVASVASVTYAGDGGDVTVNASVYELRADECGAYIRPRSGQSWPSATGMVSVTYVAGSSVADVPGAIKQAMLLMIGDWYRHRETAAVGFAPRRIPMVAAADALLAPFRRGLAA